MDSRPEWIVQLLRSGTRRHLYRHQRSLVRAGVNDRRRTASAWQCVYDGIEFQGGSIKESTDRCVVVGPGISNRPGRLGRRAAEIAPHFAPDCLTATFATGAAVPVVYRLQMECEFRANARPVAGTVQEWPNAKKQSPTPPAAGRLSKATAWILSLLSTVHYERLALSPCPCSGCRDSIAASRARSPGGSAASLVSTVSRLTAPVFATLDCWFLPKPFICKVVASSVPSPLGGSLAAIRGRSAQQPETLRLSWPNFGRQGSAERLKASPYAEILPFPALRSSLTMLPTAGEALMCREFPAVQQP